ncbi:MAG TPA: NAD(P)-dependent oxidoreductase [Clostridia bacterium]|nr:NAD(P)-dependent oxidoreductase [Clostridia bacterium]
MKIVVTDDFFVDFGGISWQPIEQYGEVFRYADTTDEDDAIVRIGNADVVFINRCRITEQVMAQCPNIIYIGTFGTGVDGVDLAAAHKYGITVCNIPGYGKNAVAQMALALLFEISRNVSLFDRKMKAQGWNSTTDDWLRTIPQMELGGKTIGIIGMGDIGYAVARVAMAMDMQVLAYRRRPDLALACEQLRFCDLEDLLSHSDIISIHCPLTDETRGMVDAAAIAKMKDGTILINTARGAVLCENDVVDALNSGKLYAVGADVFATEPPGNENALANHPRCIATPHVAWMPQQTRQRVIDISGENLRLFLAGNPQNVVVPRYDRQHRA